MLALEVKPRGKEPADALRKRGEVPAVFYGPKEKSTSIAIDERALAHVWKEAGQTSVVTLKGIGEDKDTLIHDAQFDPISGKLLHADFYALEKGKKIRISVPLEFEGMAPAEKAGHIVVKALHEVEIEVAPQELPHHLAVDLAKLANIGDHIKASQIALPQSAALITNGDEIVASVTAFVEEKEEITPAPETQILTAKPEAAASAEGGASEGKAGAPEAGKEKSASGGKAGK